MDQLQTEVADSAFKDFWDNFQFSRFRIVTRPAYTTIFALFPYLTLLVASIIADLQSGITGFTMTKEALTLWPMLIGTGFALVIIWVYHRWKDEIPVFFSWLYDGKRLRFQEGDLGQQYGEYLREYQTRLLSYKGPLLLVFIFLLFVVAINWISEIPQFISEYWISGIPQDILEYWEIDEEFNQFILIRFIIIWVFGFSVFAILSGLLVWPVYVTGRQLATLSDRFDVVVQPSHPDRCGGLKSWGDFCFNMTLPVVIGGLFLAIFGLGHSFLQDAGVFYSEETVPVFNAALILVAIPLTSISFFTPLSGVHVRMVQIKKELEDQYAKQAAGLEEQIKTNLNDPEGLAGAKQAAEELSVLRALMPHDFSYPEWPFDRNMPVILFASPVLSLALQFLVDLFSQSNCCS